MKIQEMRSGLLHLSRRSSADRWDDVVELPTVEDIMPILERRLPSDDHTAVRPKARPASELDDELWSVVSFEKVEGGALSYAEAAALIAGASGCDLPPPAAPTALFGLWPPRTTSVKQLVRRAEI